MKERWWFSSFKCSHFIWLSYVCVCVLSFFRCWDWIFFFFPSSIGTKFRRLPVDSHPYHHPFQIRLHLLSQKETNALNEREREREKHQEKLLFLCVCLCFACGAFKFFPSKKSISSLSLSLSAHLFNLLWQVVVAARSLACDIKNKTKRLEKRRMQ
jgi:hypothetical protein